MNVISLLQPIIFRIRTYFAAVLLRSNYETEPALREFNALDAYDFVEVSDIRL